MALIHKYRWPIGSLAFFLILVGAYQLQPVTTLPSDAAAWYSVIPPVLAVFLAFLTRNVFLSLGAAVLVGGFLSQVPGSATSIGAWFGGLLQGLVFVRKQVISEISPFALNSFNLQILIFITLVLSMITVIVASGGVQAIVNWLSKLAQGKRSTQVATVLMGLAIFIDDYANTMLVGSTMKPLTDKQKISREKLAFLVDATSAPIAGIAVVSTWIGYEVGLFANMSKELALGVDGYGMFFDALGYRFYCILMIFYVFLVSFSKKDFGPMLRAELRAAKTGEVLRKGGQPLGSRGYSNAVADAKAVQVVRSAFVPIAFMLAYLFGGLWVDGGGMKLLTESPFAIFSFGNWRDVISQSENNARVLAEAAGLSLIVAIIMGRVFSKLSFKSLFQAALSGVKSSLMPMLVLVLAWSIKAVCDDLHTGDFLIASIGDMLSPIWFPVIVFVIAGVTAFTTGTSWGTMAILIPVAIPLAHQLDGGTYSLVTIISLAAILDGAIFGDHCSPISDTTIMSSISTGCDHMDHVRTQIPYSLLVAFVALFVGYYFAAQGMAYYLSWLIGAGVLVVAHFGLNKLYRPDPNF